MAGLALITGTITFNKSELIATMPPSVRIRYGFI